jgi:hypothetical protein
MSATEGSPDRRVGSSQVCDGACHWRSGRDLGVIEKKMEKTAPGSFSTTPRRGSSAAYSRR